MVSLNTFISACVSGNSPYNSSRNDSLYPSLKFFLPVQPPTIPIVDWRLQEYVDCLSLDKSSPLMVIRFV